MICAHAAARAGLPAFMRLVPPARTDGMSAHAGTPPSESAIAAVLIGVAALIGGLGFAAAVVALGLIAASLWFMAWLCKREIGGQTGDVLGAFEQAGEITVLLVAVAASSWSVPAHQIRVHDPAVARRASLRTLSISARIPQPARDEDLVGGADIGAPVDMDVVLDGLERAVAVQHHHHVVELTGSPLASCRPVVIWTAPPMWLSAIRCLAASACTLVMPGSPRARTRRFPRRDLFDDSQGAVVERRVAPHQEGAMLSVGQLLAQHRFIDRGALVVPRVTAA